MVERQRPFALRSSNVKDLSPLHREAKSTAIRLVSKTTIIGCEWVALKHWHMGRIIKLLSLVSYLIVYTSRRAVRFLNARTIWVFNTAYWFLFLQAREWENSGV